MHPFVALAAGAALCQNPGFVPKPVGNLKQVMRSISLPNSNIIFDVEVEAPKDDDGWANVQNAAIAISEVATLITMPGRLRSDGQPVPVRRADWIQYSQGLVAAGQACYKAALMESQDAVNGRTSSSSMPARNATTPRVDLFAQSNRQEEIALRKFGTPDAIESAGECTFRL